MEALNDSRNQFISLIDITEIFHYLESPIQDIDEIRNNGILQFSMNNNHLKVFESILYKFEIFIK